MKEIKLSNQVYSKNFEIQSLGYNCQEVDNFLDEVNFEIAKLEREIDTLKKEKEKLEALLEGANKKNKDISMQYYNLKAQSSVPSTSNANFSNMELLNRIENLENMVQKLLDLTTEK